VHEGGVADPLIVHWPAGFGEGGEFRRQYTHAVDVMPTVLDLVGVDPPAGIAGASFAAALRDRLAPEHRTTQYYEMFGCRALYHDGWKAVTYHRIQSGKPGLDKAPWELYRVAVDPSECHDLAADEPAKLEELVQLWWAEAERNGVLPLDNRPFSDFVLDRPQLLPDRHRYAYRSGAAAVPEAVAVNVKNRSHTITAELVVPDGGVEGVLISQGSLLGGWVLFVRDGRLTYVHNLCNWEQQRVESDTTLPSGRHTLAFRFDKTGEHQGRGSLVVDGEVVGAGDIPRFTPNRFALAGAGLSVGRDASGLAVTDDYVAPFPFTGEILGEVVVEVDGPAFVDPELEAEAAITTQ
jgi:arylsulfatase